MAYDERLAERVRAVLADIDGVEEKRMFGGLTFMLRGNMCCGVAKDELMLRVEREASVALVKQPHVRPCDFTGRPMKGLVIVSPAGCKGAAALRKLVNRAVDFAGSLPAK